MKTEQKECRAEIRDLVNQQNWAKLHEVLQKGKGAINSWEGRVIHFPTLKGETTIEEVCRLIFDADYGHDGIIKELRRLHTEAGIELATSYRIIQIWTRAHEECKRCSTDGFTGVARLEEVFRNPSKQKSISPTAIFDTNGQLSGFLKEDERGFMILVDKDGKPIKSKCD